MSVVVSFYEYVVGVCVIDLRALFFLFLYAPGVCITAVDNLKACLVRSCGKGKNCDCSCFDGFANVFDSTEYFEMVFQRNKVIVDLSILFYPTRFFFLSRSVTSFNCFFGRRGWHQSIGTHLMNYYDN